MKIADIAGQYELRAPVDLLSPVARRVSPPTPGYCHACGTWDLHVRTCTCCGFDFEAQATIDDDY